MFYEAFPKELNSDLNEVLKVIPKETYNNVSIGCSENMIEYSLNQFIVKFPYRMYFVDVEFSPGVNGVLHQLLDHAGGALHHFAGGDQIRHMGV